MLTFIISKAQFYDLGVYFKMFLILKFIDKYFHLLLSLYIDMYTCTHYGIGVHTRTNINVICFFFNISCFYVCFF